MKSVFRGAREAVAPHATVAVALGAALALGLALGALLADDAAALRSADRERGALDARVARLTAERNRLRAERDQLEAQLAAAHPRPVCPQAYVSTGRLLPFFSIDRPCGWHVVYDPRPPATGAAPPGVLVEVTFLSRVPVSLAPRPGPLADLEVTQWTDDPEEDGDRLPPLNRWVAEERERFGTIRRDEAFEGGGGITVRVLDGDVASQDGDAAGRALVALWEFEDTATGARHVVRVIGFAPTRQTEQALDRLARSFRVHPR